jgi:hypothetical protein
MRRLLIAAAIGLLATSGAAWGLERYRPWEKGPVVAWRAQQRAACSGDVAGFFRHVNREAVKAGARGDVLSAPAPKVATKAERAGQELGRTLAYNMADANTEKAFTGWETDISRGSSGYLCNTELLQVDGTSVSFRRVSGATSRWTYSRTGRDDAWQLVRLAVE